MDDIAIFFASCLGIILIMVGATFLGGLVIWLLWNWLAVDLFNAKEITYWMGVGISFALSVIGGFFRSSVTVKRG